MTCMAEFQLCAVHTFGLVVTFCTNLSWTFELLLQEVMVNFFCGQKPLVIIFNSHLLHHNSVP